MFTKASSTVAENLSGLFSFACIVVIDIRNSLLILLRALRAVSMPLIAACVTSPTIWEKSVTSSAESCSDCICIPASSDCSTALSLTAAWLGLAPVWTGRGASAAFSKSRGGIFSWPIVPGVKAGAGSLLFSKSSGGIFSLGVGSEGCWSPPRKSQLSGIVCGG